MSQKAHRHFGTAAVSAGQNPKQWKCRSVVPPIFSSTIYSMDDPAEKPPVRSGYTRCENPSRNSLETCLAACENAKNAMAASSGTAAMTMVVNSTLSMGDNIVVSEDVYAGTKCYLQEIASNFGIEMTIVNPLNLTDVKTAIKPNTKVVWVDCPSNPTLRFPDIKGLADLAHSKGCLLVVDSTLLSPYFIRPLSLGADVVVHSASKFINGHSDVLMGVVCTNDDKMANKIRFMQKAVGAVPSPFDCYLVNRGLKTLHVRMRQHKTNAFAVAKFLQSSPYVEETIYPGLPSHPQHELAKAQCTGFGGMVCFKIKGDKNTARKFLMNLKQEAKTSALPDIRPQPDCYKSRRVNNLNIKGSSINTRISLVQELCHQQTAVELLLPDIAMCLPDWIIIATMSMGGVESVAEACCLMTRVDATEEENKKLGITNNMIRLSVGLEEVTDLIEDLSQALNNAQQ